MAASKRKAFKCKHTDKSHYVRGLCYWCYTRKKSVLTKEEIDEHYPKLVEEKGWKKLYNAWEDLTEIGFTDAQVANRMKVTVTRIREVVAIAQRDKEQGRSG